jgi:amino acid adenylation domain-containing protein
MSMSEDGSPEPYTPPSADDLRLLAQWNETKHPYPDDTVVHVLFDAQAERTPDRIALLYGDDTLTFATLQQRSNRLAHHLVEQGVQAGTPVGVAVHRSLEMVIAMLAILKASGAYLPLDPAYPRDRLALMIEDSGLELILTSSDVVGLPESRATLINVDAFDGVAYSSDSPANRATPDDPMYIPFTSGSTGRPKGVLASHRGMLNRFNWQWETYPFSEHEVCCQKTTLNFADHVWETWGPLLKGHTLVLVPEAVVQDGARFVALLAEHRIERLVTVPSVISTLLKTVPELSAKLSCLRYCTLSGERLTTDLAAEFAAALPDTVLLNFYGMSEGSADATWYDQRWNVAADTFPIGRPIHNMRVYLLDDERRPVPIGAIGEIFLGGVGLANGYLGRPDLTAERFLPDPFVDDPRARMYRSGDLGRWLPNGILEYIGRVDHQVKVRGIRIEPGEIEAAARVIGGVDDVVVTAHAIGEDLQLVAYLTLTGAGAPGPAAIRQLLAAQLPDYMVPARIIVLDEIPRTPNGKVDRSALPDPTFTRPASDTAYVPPSTDVERRLVEIWQELLVVDRIGVNDSFFELGGDSLLALRCIMRANGAGINLIPTAIFEHPTIAELARAADGASQVGRDGEDIVTGPTPLTPGQLRFLTERRSPDPNHWNVSALVRAESLSPSALRVAVEALVRHHDALRLRLWEADGRWHQEVAGLPETIPFESHDLSRMSPREREMEIERICSALQQSFDFGQGLLLRVAHFDCGSDPDRLFATIHHFAVDGLSETVFWEDFEQAYRQAADGARVSLPPRTTSFRRWALQLEALAQTPRVADRASEWLGLPWGEVSSLPTDLDPDRTRNTNASAAAVEVQFSTEDTRRLLLRGRRPEHVLIAALARCLSTWTASDTVLIDVLSHGRDATLEGVNLSRTLGFMLSYNPLVLTHRGWPATPEVVEAVTRQIEDGPEGFSFELLRFLAADEVLRHRLSALPKADVLFNYGGTEGYPGSLWVPATEPTGHDASPRGLRQHPIAVRAILTPDLRMIFVYSTALHTATNIEAKAAQVADTVRSLVREPRRRV